jgi:hypothetical protein
VEDGRRIIGWPEIEQKLKEAGDVLMERAIELQRQADRKKAAQEEVGKKENAEIAPRAPQTDDGGGGANADSSGIDWTHPFFDSNTGGFGMGDADDWF